MYRKTILVAGNSNLWGLFAHSFFGRAGFTLLRAGEGGGALAMVEEHDPGLVLIDLGLPAMDEFCLQLKKDA
ncbi:MAG: hypothetical protein IH614_04990, partial [Desulfuromonadales bacterium]|nr:hypothetical protein [Desulfuromonadales bacterium]